MIPKHFPKEPVYAPFPPFVIPMPGLPVIPPGLVRADFPPEAHLLAPLPAANIETMLQNHRRKMLRRAANRRSAQLSRARKKAHLEDLKAENAKLQRLVDILESQPEMVFCVTATGKMTYVSERTMNFMNVTGAVEDCDDDPTHISQLLSKESVSELLEVIAKLKISLFNRSENDPNMLFSVKVVNFHDTSGRPIVGYLRCSKVNRKSSASSGEFQGGVEATQEKPSPPQGPPTKKQKTSKASSSSKAGKEQPDVTPALSEPNLKNFNLLADCVTSLSEEKGSPTIRNKNVPGGVAQAHEHSSSGSLTTNSDQGNASPTPSDSEDEFVCVIRTNDDCFVPYRSNKDVLMFSSALSTSAMEAHDYDFRSTIDSSSDQADRVGSPSDSHNSNEVKTGSDSSNNSSNKMKDTTSSEGDYEDNNSGDLDSN